MKKKADYKVVIFLLGLIWLVSCSNDSAEPVDAIKDPTLVVNETWNVIIEPEYVLIDADKQAHRVAPVMEGLDTKGKRIATFNYDDINGIILEEGFRYNLEIAAKLNTNENGATTNTYTLKEIYEKTPVNINREGMREVTLDVVPVRVIPKSTADFQAYEKLCGINADTNEKMDLLMGEIKGLDYQEFYGKSKMNHLRIKASITPSTKPVYNGKNYRIRLVKVELKEEMERDSILYVDPLSSADPGILDSTQVVVPKDAQWGDFEMMWSVDGRPIGQGVLHTVNSSASAAGIFMDVDKNMTKFFVDSIFKKPYQTMEPQKVIFDVGEAVYNSVLSYKFVGYTTDAYYYDITDWQYYAVAKIDDTFYKFEPVVDYAKSSIAYDSKNNQWMGVIIIKEVNLSEAYRNPAPWTEKYLMSPPMKIVFNTVRKVK